MDEVTRYWWIDVRGRHVVVVERGELREPLAGVGRSRAEALGRAMPVPMWLCPILRPTAARIARHAAQCDVVADLEEES